MKNFFPKFVLKQFSTYVAIIVIFVNNNVLDKNLECVCNNQVQVHDCGFYMVLPTLILFVLQLWIDKTVQKVCGYLCTCPCPCQCPSKDNCNCCKGFFGFLCVLLYHSLKAVFIGLLWVVSLLIDGDWYVCCRNDQSERYPKLACKDKHNITSEEREIITKLKNKSRVIGFSALLGIICLAAFMSWCGWKCCKKHIKSNRRLVYDKLILKEEGNVLKEILRKAAKDRLTEEINKRIRGQQGQHWETCFHAAADLIKESAPPKIPETEENGESLQESRRLLRMEDRRQEEKEPLQKDDLETSTKV